ncbi:MAG: hypothetical protein WBF71_09330 [Microthrixaceae bacterium]
MESEDQAGVPPVQRSDDSLNDGTDALGRSDGKVTACGRNAARGSTEPDDTTKGWTRFEYVLRAFVYLVIFGVIALAVSGTTGLKTRTASASNDSLKMTVTYGQVTRPGIPTPLVIRVSSATDDPLPAQIHLGINESYLALLDGNGPEPAPDSAGSVDGMTTWTYSTNGARTFTVDLGADVDTNVHSGTTGSARLTAEGSKPLNVRFRTWIWP